MINNTKKPNLNFYKILLISFIATILLVTFSYYFLDKPIAFFVNRIQLPFNYLLILFTNIKPYIYVSSLIGIMVYFFIQQETAFLKFPNFKPGLLVYSLSIIIANAFTDALKHDCGRDWPKTWYHHNLSLIHDHAYGFHWFHGSQAYSSFPSGHMTVICAAMIPLIIFLPKLRWLWIFIILFMAFALLFLDYHFLSDIITGSFIGTVTALCTKRTIDVTFGV
ncbi:MAG: phosphatase PAP2 family protein [Gammaproteobacteria bacterium]|nr:phosphatase PAP2 family protein [Gammaproteobacteria bacterium]